MPTPKGLIPACQTTLNALLLGLLLTACRIPPPTEDPMPSDVLLDPPGAEVTWMLLPGIGDRMGRFALHDWPAPVAERGLPWKLVATDAHFGYYRDESLSRQLGGLIDIHAGESRGVILAGISLGGLGSLGYYCRSRDPRVTGIVLMAPFLGEDELISEIQRAGGPRHWQPDQTGRPISREIWSCLARWSEHDPWLLLAFGSEDRLAPGHRLLARQLDPHRVIELDGGHAWSTWKRLWIQVVGRVSLGGIEGPPATPSG